MILRQMMILTVCGWLAVNAAAWVSGQTASFGSEQLEKRSRELAGPNAVDCGRVALYKDPTHATKCALAANKAGKPFRVLYDVQGIDSFVAEAYVRLPDGTLEGLVWDSDPSGGNRRGPGVVNVMGCPMPVQVYASPTGQLTCVAPKAFVPLNAKLSKLDQQ